MNGIILPHDIKRYIRKKAIVYLVKLLLWYVVVAAVNIAIWNYFRNLEFFFCSIVIEPSCAILVKVQP